MTRPLVFAFDLEPGMSESEIQTLWNNTQSAQTALDKFLAGEFTEQEMTDLLSSFDIDLEETQATLEENAQCLGLIAI